MSLTTNLEWFTYSLEHANLMIEKGLYQNYLKQLSEYKDKKDAIIDEIDIINFSLKDVLEKHPDSWLKYSVKFFDEFQEIDCQCYYTFQ